MEFFGIRILLSYRNVSKIHKLFNTYKNFLDSKDLNKLRVHAENAANEEILNLNCQITGCSIEK